MKFWRFSFGYEVERKLKTIPTEGLEKKLREWGCIPLGSHEEVNYKYVGPLRYIDSFLRLRHYKDNDSYELTFKGPVNTYLRQQHKLIARSEVNLELPRALGRLISSVPRNHTYTKCRRLYQAPGNPPIQISLDRRDDASRIEIESNGEQGISRILTWTERIKPEKRKRHLRLVHEEDD